MYVIIYCNIVTSWLLSKTVNSLNLSAIDLYFTENFPAGKTGITVNHLQPGRPPQVIVKNVEFLFQSKINVVYKILSTENDPLKFLCSSFQVNDTRNVDQILSKNFEKKVPEGIDLVKCSKSVLVQSRGNWWKFYYGIICRSIREMRGVLGI